MSLRRAPNPNRNHPLYCPYCAGEELFPDTQDDFAWSCRDCTRVFSVRYHGQNDPEHRPTPAPSTAEAYQKSLARRGHREILRDSGETGGTESHDAITEKKEVNS